MRLPQLNASARLTIIYIVISGFWIAFSDYLVGHLKSQPRLFDFINTGKGFFFVGATGLLLYFMTRNIERHVRDVEQRNNDQLLKANQRLHLSKGILDALARSNLAALTAKNEHELYREIGDSLVQLADLRFVWFGWVNPVTGQIKIEASSGKAHDFEESFHCTTDPESPFGQGAVGRIIRENRIIVSNHLQNDPSLHPWEHIHQQNGFESGAFIPLKLGTRQGAFCAYAGTVDFFNEENTTLMQRLADDLIHGLNIIATRVERIELLSRIKESESRYRSLFQNGAVPMLLINHQTGEICDANPSACNLYGWPHEELTRKNLLDIDIPSPENPLNFPLKNIVPGVGIKYRSRIADGSIRDVEVFCNTLEIDGKEFLYSIIHDITDRLKGERSLADALTLNEVALNSSPLGMILHHKDGTPLRNNEAAASILGLEQERLATQNILHTPLGEDNAFLDTLNRALSTNQTAQAKLRVVNPDNSPLLLQISITPFRFNDEQCLFTILENQTEQNRVLHRLNLMQTAIDAAPSAIVITDALGCIEWANSAFTSLTGYSLEDVQGRSTNILKSGRQSQSFYLELWDTISRGKIWSGDLQNMRRDGSIYWEHMVVAPVMTSSGTIEHYVAIKQDISAQKDMEKQIARTQRLESIGLLAGGIAHDLNNVLAPILMAMDLFKLYYQKPEDQHRIDMVRNSAERGANIVRQVLTFARGVDGERMTIRPKHLIKEVRNLLSETLPRNIDIEVRLPEKELPQISGDPTQLHQVLLNLGVNSRDSMPSGGVLTFSAWQDEIAEPKLTQSGLTVAPGYYVTFCVKDTGTGIPADVLDHIFEPFFTTKARGRGTGLGLSTVLGIVRGHGGALDVTTELGRGTEFRVYVPCLSTGNTNTPFKPAPPKINGAGREVLLVDDEEMVRSVTGMALNSKGFKYIAAADGQNALDIFKADPDRFVAVILDRVMPKVGGDQVAKFIKTVRPNLPIILISGLLSDKSNEPIEKGEYRKHGDVVLQKPFSHSDLFHALASVIPTEI